MAAGPATGGELGWWPGFPTAGVACLALLWRRGHPRTVVAVMAVCASGAGGVGYLITPLLPAPLMVALYGPAVREPRRVAQTWYLGAVALIVATAMLSDHCPWPLKALSPTFWLLFPALIGAMVQTRRAYLDAVQARAEHAERTREEETRHRVAEERMRIPRELHDVVAHHLALANAQAGTAVHLTRTHPEQAEKVLAGLGETTSAARRELKATVGLLRQHDDADSPLDPAPGLARLPELVSAFSSAGLRVTITVDGREQPLSPGTDLTAFRIAQEALTNVAKPAGVDTAQVRLAYSGTLLGVSVTNEGAGHAPPSGAGGGFGVIGMRERAQSAGGTLSAGPRPEGGYAVTAELPLHH